MSHRRTATAIAAAGLLVSAAVPALASHGVAHANKTVTFKATDFAFSLNTPMKIKKGTTVLFKMTNKGAVVHDFALTTLHKKTPLTQPGKSSSVKVTFNKKGSFKYICTVPRHAEAGMQGKITVT